MKITALTIIATVITMIAFSQDKEDELWTDSIENSFTYQHGTITLRNGIGKILIPEGFKYLNAPQAEKVIVDVWAS